MKTKPCGPDCHLCDCGRTDNTCIFKESKIRGLKKKLGILLPSVVKKKLKQKDKKAARKKGRK